jgi:hypothetical protein
MPSARIRRSGLRVADGSCQNAFKPGFKNILPAQFQKCELFSVGAPQHGHRFMPSFTIYHVLSDLPGRSGKTNGVVIEAKMLAGRRRKLFQQETGWRETNYAVVSVISMTSAYTFADKKQIC